jgi:hypothetical protein
MKGNIIMEHIVQFAISMDDEAIKQRVAEKAEKEIMDNLQREVGRVIFERSSYYAYGNNNKGYDPNHLSSWAKMQFDNFLKEHKDEIIAGAAKELGDRLVRTKAGKAILEDLKG